MASPRRVEQVEERGRSARKRAAILSAATDIFLKGGYLGTNVDAIAVRSAVSKQTVYKHFGSKEALFIEIVSSMTGEAGDLVQGETPEPDDPADLERYLRAYADKQLTAVLTPRLMQLRRLVIAEVARFPDLGRVLYERGPQRALTNLTAMFERLAARGLRRHAAEGVRVFLAAYAKRPGAKRRAKATRRRTL